jgi:branched-chain amino acid aminotransferase
MKTADDFYFDGTGFRTSGLLDAGTFQEGDFYEVLRVMDGICLFVTDHLNRLRESVTLSGLTQLPDTARIRDIIVQLISLNKLEAGNIKLVWKAQPGGEQALYAFCIPFSYPGRELYVTGVPTALYKARRLNPNVKRLVPSFQDSLQRFIAEKNVYEALLADEQDRILEGSRSNVFFIRDAAVFTAPGDRVLKGITRMKVIDLCNNLNICLIENAVSINHLIGMEGVFITGTSPKILPVCRIDDREYRTGHPLLNKLITGYDSLIREEIERQGRLQD